MCLCPMSNGPFRALLDGVGNLLDGDLFCGGPTSPGGLRLGMHCPQITELFDPFLYRFIPNGKFLLPMIQTEVRQESPPSFLQ